MKVYVYWRDRSEEGMASPVIRRLAQRGMLSEAWQDADIVLIPGDRREAMRFALEVYEAGKAIAHHGWCDVSETAREVHYDHRYRDMLSAMSSISLPIRDYPTMVDDLPAIMIRQSVPTHYIFVAWNASPWAWEDLPDLPGNTAVVAAAPGNDGDRDRVSREIVKRGWMQLPPLPRSGYLAHLNARRRGVGQLLRALLRSSALAPEQEDSLGREAKRWSRHRAMDAEGESE